MGTSIFLSHNSNDKPFVKKLALDLKAHGIKCWIDEAEIGIGESLIEKISSGIDNMEYLAVILSPNSVSSSWVQKEVNIALTQEINKHKIKVLPLLYKKCDLPIFLMDKKYADFSEGSNYIQSFKTLMNSLGIVFNKSVFENTSDNNLLNSVNKTIYSGLRIYHKPFQRPFQYIGMTIDKAAKEVNGIPNEVGNIIVEDEDCRMLLEAEGNFISFVEVEFKKTAPFYQNQEFDSEAILGAVSINPAELTLETKQVFSHKYFDHRNKLQVLVLCAYDSAPLSISFSPKYYGM